MRKLALQLDDVEMFQKYWIKMLFDTLVYVFASNVAQLTYSLGRFYYFGILGIACLSVGCFFHNSIALPFVLQIITIFSKWLLGLARSKPICGLWTKVEFMFGFGLNRLIILLFVLAGEYTRENWFYVPFFFWLIRFSSRRVSLALTSFGFLYGVAAVDIVVVVVVVVVVSLFLSNHASRFRLVFINHKCVHNIAICCSRTKS